MSLFFIPAAFVATCDARNRDGDYLCELARDHSAAALQRLKKVSFPTVFF
jgi:hypothetical protein